MLPPFWWVEHPIVWLSMVFVLFASSSGCGLLITWILVWELEGRTFLSEARAGWPPFCDFMAELISWLIFMFVSSIFYLSISSTSCLLFLAGLRGEGVFKTIFDSIYAYGAAYGWGIYGLTVKEITLLPICTALVISGSSSICPFASTRVPNFERLSSR